jgi:uncharacterized membrane protein
MTPAQLIRGSARAGFGVCLLLLFSCAEHPPTAPDYARGGASGGGGGKGPTVKSTNPPNGPRGTTLDVHVLGTGFDAGSQARWALDGDTTVAVTKVITNTTTYVSSTELIANITIGTDANLDLYDVMVVTGGGKKGIGIEKFEVTVLINFLPDLGGTSAAYDINTLGTIVGGSGNPAGTTYNPVRWTRSGTGWSVSTLAGSGNGVALGINDGGTVVGQSAGNAMSWTATGLAVNLGAGVASDVNENGIIVGRTNEVAALWMPLSAGAWTSPVLLPGFPGATGNNYTSMAHAISDANAIVGDAWDANGIERAVRWELQAGQWVGPILMDNADWGWVEDINLTGDMAGGFCTAACDFSRTPTFSAVLWPFGQPAEILPSLGGPNSAGHGINTFGDIVGRSSSAPRRNSPLVLEPVWWSNGVLRRLFLPPGYTGGIGEDINDNGQAVGAIHTSAGGDRAVVWTLHP